MKSFDLKYHGNDDEDAEIFLKDLKDCIDSSSLSRRRAVKAISTILFGEAKKWLRGEQRFKKWKSFEKKFKRRFAPHRNDDDILEDLNNRTQGEDESIAKYLSDVRIIISLFKRSPKEKKLVRRILKNLLPKYKRFIEMKRIKTFDKLLSEGQKYERSIEEIKRRKPPISKELMHVRYAAYVPSEKEKVKVASTREVVQATIAEDDKKKSSKKKNKRKKKSDKNKSDDKTAAVGSQPPQSDEKKKLPLKPFTGTCTICNTEGHKGFFCLKRNGRQVCIGCGKLDTIISNCEFCRVVRKKRAENRKEDAATSPATSQC